MTTATETTERPILFSGPMVRAILADQKTQTRRLWKLPSHAEWYKCGPELDYWTYPNDPGWWHVEEAACPYGKPGDRLWVRETWRPSISHSHGENSCDCGDVIIRYTADGYEEFFSEYDRIIPTEWTFPDAANKGNVPSIFMPRWASRILLEITEVRVERVQEICHLDAIAEGVCHAWSGFPKLHTAGFDDLPQSMFAAIWRQINGSESWDTNPWVWVVSFKRINK